MAIKGSTSNRKSISARNSSYDANGDSNRQESLNLKIENKKASQNPESLTKKFTPSS